MVIGEIMSGMHLNDLLECRYQLELQSAEMLSGYAQHVLDDYSRHAYEFLTGDNQSRQAVINIQPGDPDTIELAHFQIIWLQSLGVKPENILITIANPIIDASYPITNYTLDLNSETITIESCTLDKLTISDNGQRLITALRESYLIQEDKEKNLLTINIPYSWFVANKDKISGIIGKNLVDSISEPTMLVKILGFIIPQILLLSRYEEDQKVAEFINNKLTALNKKGINAHGFALYLDSKLSNLNRPIPTPILFLKQRRDQAALLCEEFYNANFRSKQDQEYGKIFVDTILNRAVVNSKLSQEFHNKYHDVQVISSGIYTEPINSATYKGITAKSLSGKVSNPKDKTEHNGLAPNERRKLAVDAAKEELHKANPDNTGMLDAYKYNDLQKFESFLQDPNTIIITGAPNTFYSVLMRSFVGDEKIDTDLVKKFSAKYGSHMQILFAGTTDPNKLNLTGAGYNECADKFSAFLNLMLNNLNLNVLTDLIKSDETLLKAFNNYDLAKDNDIDYVATTSDFTQKARIAYDAKAPAFCTGIILLSVWLQKLAMESKNEQEFATNFKQSFEPVVFLTREEYSKIKPLSQYGYGDAKSLLNSVVAIRLADVLVKKEISIVGKIELMPKPEKWKAFLGENKNAFKFAIGQLKELEEARSIQKKQSNKIRPL